MRVFYSVMAFVAIAGTAHAAPWAVCGKIAGINPDVSSPLHCTLPNRPQTQYEYGIAYNTTEPVPVVCTNWNGGTLIANKTPYLVYSDNPLLGMRYGGFVFYKNTAASDDNACGDGYRHRYWALTTDNEVEGDLFSHGCYSSHPLHKKIDVYCRLR